MRRGGMNVTSPLRRRLAFLAGLAVLLLVVTGCGGSSSSSCKTHVTRADDGTLAAGNCAFDTSIAVDVTAFPRTQEAVGGVVGHVLRSANGTITHGGHLRVTAFGRLAAREIVIYDGDVPALADQDETQRGSLEDSLRTALRGTVTAVLNGAQDRPAIARQIAQLSAGGGTDVARAVRDAAATGSSGREHAAVVLTDGWHLGPDFSLARVVDGNGPLTGAVAWLTAHAGKSADRDAVLEMSGLGYTPTRYTGNETPRRDDRLQAVWGAVCHRLRPGRCSINTSV